MAYLFVYLVIHCLATTYCTAICLARGVFGITRFVQGINALKSNLDFAALDNPKEK